MPANRSSPRMGHTIDMSPSATAASMTDPTRYGMVTTAAIQTAAPSIETAATAR
jgi:hypothetical protein